MDGMRLRRLDPDGTPDEDFARADRLERRGTRVGVFTSPQVCALDVSLLPDD